jgi:arabinose-5-phosphate isomerase
MATIDESMQAEHAKPGALVRSSIIEAAKKALRVEATAIMTCCDRLGEEIVLATDAILSSAGKVVVCGVGKSGHVGHKLASTFCSTGTPAVFLHPSEAVHGDLGVYRPRDPTVIISKSGATAELVQLIPLFREFESTLIGIIGNKSSPLAREVDILLDATVVQEADPLNIAPTASTTVALAIGDALAASLMSARSFTNTDFARFHPGGQLGRNLTLTVADVMHSGEDVAWVRPETSFRELVVAMTEHPLGAACVLNENNALAGLVTDGDLRRAVSAHEDIQRLKVADIMRCNPTAIGAGASLQDAIRVMEDRPSQISVLPVLAVDGTCSGLLRLHDVYQPKL